MVEFEVDQVGRIVSTTLTSVFSMEEHKCTICCDYILAAIREESQQRAAELSSQTYRHLQSVGIIT